MTEFGRGVDPFEVDLLEGLARGVGVERLAEGDDSLLDAGDGALEQDKVVLDLAVVDESSEAGERGLLALEYYKKGRKNGPGKLTE